MNRHGKAIAGMNAIEEFREVNSAAGWNEELTASHRITPFAL
jgi:hypothetical protein